MLLRTSFLLGNLSNGFNSFRGNRYVHFNWVVSFRSGAARRRPSAQDFRWVMAAYDVQITAYASTRTGIACTTIPRIATRPEFAGRAMPAAMSPFMQCATLAEIASVGFGADHFHQ